MIDRACLSINNSCNLHCRYCNFRQTELITNDEKLNESDIDRILFNILEYSRKNNISLFKLGIVGAGEPLLNFDIIKYIIQYVKQKDADNILSFYTITNGTLINDSIIAFFYKNKQRITLNFSLDGYEELHNYGKEAFKKTIYGIKQYEDLFNEKPILNCTVSRKTTENKEAVIDFFIKNGFENVNFSQLVDVEEQNLVITYEEYQKYLQYIQGTKIIFRQNRKEKKYDCRTYGQLCGAGRTNIFITKQGIYPCCRFYKNENYKIADTDTALFEVEEKMLKMIKPVKDGKCYYNINILKRSDL